MSIDLNALATWTYEDFTLTHVASQQSVTIDVAANIPIHEILSSAHWLNLGSKTDYSDDPADWVERSIQWNRASEDPPVLSVEQTIDAADYVEYTVIELEDSPDYSADLQSMADILNDGHSNGFTKAHTRQLMKKMVHLLQTAGIIG